MEKFPLQLSFTGRLEKLILDWAQQNGIRLHAVHCVVPFVVDDRNLSVWLFYDSDNTKLEYESNGTNEMVKAQVVLFLSELDYPAEYLEELNFVVDSDENVRNNFEGSYFYRLR